MRDHEINDAALDQQRAFVLSHKQPAKRTSEPSSIVKEKSKCTDNLDLTFLGMQIYIPWNVYRSGDHTSSTSAKSIKVNRHAHFPLRQRKYPHSRTSLCHSMVVPGDSLTCHSPTHAKLAGWPLH